MFMRMVYDEKLAQAAYIFGCQRTGEAIVIDPERDVDRYIGIARNNGLRIAAVAETHIHADFVSGSRELAERVGAKVYVSAEGGPDWSYQWLDKKNGGGAYDHHLLRDWDSFRIGAIEFRAMHTPGHTPEHMVFVVTDHGSGATEPIGVVTGDFLFVGDLGRPDLLESAAGKKGAMEPGAKDLFRSLRVLEGLPEFAQVWPGHGAGSACGKALGAVPMSTVGYERRFNSALRAATGEKDFVDFILAGQPEPPLYFADMKRVNKEGPKVLGELPSPTRLTPEELRLLDAKGVALVDTRPWAAFREGHVPGSLYLPLDKSFPTDAGSFIREDEKIVLIVSPGGVEEAVRDLVRIGRDRVTGWFHSAELDRFVGEGHALAQAPEVEPERAAEMIGSGGPGVLDVRRRTEYDRGHLPDAVNISHTRLASRLDEAPSTEPLLVHCQSGIRSAKSTAFLRRMGFDAVNVRGGYAALEKLGSLRTVAGAE
ncbi:MAG: MBL fold metallo-hydrolase [Phycisphaerales bacterium]|nr:MBL fold metallo-hydrolase [Phycisphaerales bacterium]